MVVSRRLSPMTSKRPGFDPPTYEAAANTPAGNPVPNPAGQPPQVPPPMFVQQTGGRTVIIQQQQQPGVTYVAANQRVIVVHEIKIAPSFDPYPEHCQYCNVQVITQRRFAMGNMACMFIFLSIIFFPFIFFICCSSFKDAHHFCPLCHRLIAIRRR